MMLKFIVAATAVLAIAGTAQAGVVMLGSQAELDAAGTIAQNTNFDNFGIQWSYPDNPYAVGDLSFTASGQLLVGGIDGFGLSRSLLTDNNIIGTTISVSGGYNLFGLNAGNFFTEGNANFQVTTNLGSYQFTPILSSAAYGGALTFVGFQADAGEFITSVRVSSSFAPGFTDVQIGNAAAVAGAVPEPATWAMLIAGFGMVGFMARRRTTVVSA